MGQISFFGAGIMKVNFIVYQFHILVANWESDLQFVQYGIGISAMIKRDTEKKLIELKKKISWDICHRPSPVRKDNTCLIGISQPDTIRYPPCRCSHEHVRDGRTGLGLGTEHEWALPTHCFWDPVYQHPSTTDWRYRLKRFIAVRVPSLALSLFW